MMSLSTRREVLASMRLRYRNATRAQKSRILDELVATYGYARKHAIAALRQRVLAEVKGPAVRVRRATYGPDVGLALLRMWKLSRGLCSKRLVAQLPALIDALERHSELALPDSVKSGLLSISAATSDRLLRRLRRSDGISTTTPGTLLRNQIPLHTFSDWKDAKPGFMEVDLVAHCGDTAAGQFAYTLTATDVASGWTECVAMPNRGQLAVLAALETVKARLPFDLLGIDTDNGAEFINVTLKTFCEDRKITFTRGRPYKKNDQCHVEQKNGSVVRPLVGYARYEGTDAVEHINKLYAAHRLHLNFFSPSAKLQDKKRDGAKVVKKYDDPKTPYTRLVDHGVWSKQQQGQVQAYYLRLNPAAIGRRIDDLEAGLKRHAVRTTGGQGYTPAATTKGRLPDNLFGKKDK